ncbi:tetratricopeptide repeat protein [Azospirillum sp. sgz302134]
MKKQLGAAAGLSTAIERHQAGKISEAEAIYRSLIRRDPKNNDALHLLGVACYQTGRLDEAESHIKSALRFKKDAAYYSNLGLVLHDRGRWEEAVAACRSALDLHPHYPEAHNNLGNSLKALGRLDEAIASFCTAMDLRPGYLDAINNLAHALFQMGDLDNAAAAYGAVLELQPNHGEARNNLGAVLQRQGRLDEAVTAFRAALDLRPGFPDALNNLGNALRKLGRLDEAVAAHRAALDQRPDDPNILNNLGLSLQEQEHPEGAIAAYRAALDRQPEHRDARYNLGTALQDLGRLEEAAAAYRAVLDLWPDDAETLNNLGYTLHLQGHMAEADEAYRAALALRPDHPEIHLNRSLVLLLQGRLREGWDEYEWRWLREKERATKRDFAQPLWSGEELAGRTILLHPEQGLGDTLQFVRYAPLVARRGGRVVLEAPPPLVALFRTLPGVERIIPQGDPLPAFDLHCPLLSLPRAFGTTLDSVPAEIPYLSVEPERAAVWRERLAGPGLKVGLVWAGNPSFARDRERSPGLEPLLPVLDVPNCRVFGLQFGPGRDALAGRVLPASFTDLGPELGDFRDNAAAILAMDVVVTSCTATAHLAGALGVPVWVLLSYVPDWRWMLDRDDSPWYPTACLFRQQHPGDWTATVERVVAELSRVAAGESESLRPSTG